VKLHGAARDVVIEETTGETRRFRATPSRTTTWALATLVEPILYPEDDQSSNHWSATQLWDAAQATWSQVNP
jgi:hypothetical protein